MRLVDLDPEWIYDYEPTAHSHRRSADLSIANAQGVMFECPKCGHHSILTWFRDRGVPDEAPPGPSRWTVEGSSFADLTLTPSVLLTSGCAWHGWVRAGEVTGA